MDDQKIIESYTYARETASSRPLDHLDYLAKESIRKQSVEVQSTLDMIFSIDDYEARLRYIQSGKENKES